jgi:hypothetical protein
MLVHPQAFFDVALGESGLRLAGLTGSAHAVGRAEKP